MKAYLPPGSELPKIGDRLLDKFKVERLIGQGGAGVVYAAHHELLEQRIALKLLLADPGSEAASRFVNEAKLAARITSEHVCRVMDVGTLPSGVPYIAMEYLEGRDLDAALAAGPLEVSLATDYVLQALDAVAQAHAQGIVHRDLKPSNLYLAARTGGPPILKVLDFGISKGDVLGTEQNVTSSRAILGSPSYMSPEQIKNARNVDARADIWALGVILYEMTAGKAPFLGETVGEVFAKILEAEPPPLREVAPGLPDGFDAVVAKCLARDREDRYANVGDLALALAPFASGIGPALVPRIRGAVSAVATVDLSRNNGALAPVAPAAPSAVGSATAAPWIESQDAPRSRSRLLVLVPIAFVLGGVSVYFATHKPPGLLPPSPPSGGGLAVDASPLAAPSEEASRDAEALGAGEVIAVGEPDASADAPGDAGDAGDEEEDEDDGGVDEEDDAAAPHAAVPRGTPRPAGKGVVTKKPPKKKKKPPKKR